MVTKKQGDKLSTYELVTGVLSFLPDHRFPQQRFFDFFVSCLEKRVEVSKRVHSTVLSRNERLADLQRILSILEIGKFIEVSQPNPVSQYYRVRPTMAEAVKMSLNAKGTMEPNAEFFRRLSQELKEPPAT